METKFASLELHGYKTFAKQTNLLFPARITAIVGPNGSGKSNVADSIRWVLGEQSYSLLRAKKTEDMIYIGSDQRARAGMASVSITFNNENNWLPIDYAEVVLTRRAYRNGQNEYLINNQRVRLKDFHELLSKTGLSDRTYTIIGQGLVDVALSIKADERGKLFEEAAGIGLYRSRKEEALKNLETTERNLERATDIVDEIKPRLRALEKQASKVSEYKLVQESLQKNLREWYGYHWFKALEEVSLSKAELEVAQTSSEKTLTLVRNNDKVVIEQRNDIAEKRRVINLLREQMHDQEQTLQTKSQELAILTERKRSSLQSQAQLDLDIVNLQEALQSGDSGLEVAKAEVERLDGELQELMENFRKVEVDLSAGRKEKKALDAQRSELQNKLMEAEKRTIVLRSRKNELSERLQSFQQSSQNSQQAVKSLSLEEEKNQKEQNDLTKSLNDLETQLKNLDQERKNIFDSQIEIKKILDQNMAQVNRLNLEKNKLTSRLDLMNQGQESLAGFSEGAKALMKNQKLHKDITDLASKLDVQEKYENAVAAALGEAIDLLVIMDGKSEKDLIREIGDSIKDRVALISEASKGIQKRNRQPEGHGIIGNAADLVNVSGQMKPLIELLLNQFLVVNTLDSVYELIDDQGENKFNLVTLAGEVFLKNGMIKLGKGQSAGKVSHVRIKKELEKSIANLEKSLGEATQIEKQHRQKMAGFDDQLAKIQIQQKDFNQQSNDLKKQLNAVTLNLEKNRGQRKWIEKQFEDNSRQIQKSEQVLTDLSEQAKQTEIQIMQLKGKLEEIKSLQKEPQLDELEHQFQYLQMETKIMGQALAHAKSTYQSQETRLDNDRQRMAQLVQRQAVNDELINTLTDSISEMAQEVDKLKQEIEGLKNSQIDPNETSLAKMERHYQQLTITESEIQNEMSIKERQVTHFQLELARRQEKLESLRSRIEDDFGLIELEYPNEYSMPTPLPFPDMVIESLPQVVQLTPGLDEVIKEQKAQLRRIGVVNLGAESEYKEVKERYTSFTAQITDLKAAILDIQRIVKELDEIMRQEFLATFKAVNVEFSKMFYRLFNGGSARLILSDEEAPIEGGIEIEARLPGKREQGLVLLSGGERSLTAVALVFALLKISPTPFCVLDEVDAMLDESNVGRFIELIRDLSVETQFLLITHNRNTVQAADVIYGVTMGKDSASQVISLKLDEVDESYVK
ncbi:MAG: chromosome segregation protein SMC [Anaerolineaceae bacterium]